MADSNTGPEVTIEDRVERLEEELSDWQRKDFLNQSIIEEYRQALAGAQLALATANAQLKLALQPTA